MTIYARSDISAVSVSDAHGGCGKTHSRPAPGGDPVALWGLDCVQCETHLRFDPHWSPTISEVPETHDEQLTREDFEKRGVLDERALMAMALAKMTGIELPDTLKSRITGTVPGRAAETAVMAQCPDGHQVAATAKFCGECGKPVGAPALPPAAAEGGDAPVQELAALPVKDLRALAKDRGVDASGSKADILGRLLQEA